jgi:ribosome-associated protein
MCTNVRTKPSGIILTLFSFTIFVTKQQTYINASEYSLTAIRSSGPGGQHVNKVSTGILLRFDIEASSLLPDVKERLLLIADSRITKEGVIVIKSTNSRSQEKNKLEAIERLQSLIDQAANPPKQRKKTKPSKDVKEKRLEMKARKGVKKELRKKPTIGD